jgi:hypothetical protein
MVNVWWICVHVPYILTLVVSAEFSFPVYLVVLIYKVCLNKHIWIFPKLSSNTSVVLEQIYIFKKTFYSKTDWTNVSGSLICDGHGGTKL